MTVLWRPAAIADLQSTLVYIKHKLKKTSAAEALKAKVFSCVALLEENPYMGASLKAKFDLPDSVNYRYLIVSKQIVFYQIVGNAIEITRILVGRTDYMRILFPLE